MDGLQVVVEGDEERADLFLLNKLELVVVVLEVVDTGFCETVASNRNLS